MQTSLKFGTWLLLTLLGWLVGLVLFAATFSLLVRTLPFFTQNSENPTSPFVANAGWLAAGVVAIVNILGLCTTISTPRLRQIMGLLYAGIVLFLPIRELGRSLHSTLTADRLDWSAGGEPVQRSVGEWLAAKLILASEEYLVPTLALAVTFALLLVLLDQLGQRLRRRGANSLPITS